MLYMGRSFENFSCQIKKRRKHIVNTIRNAVTACSLWFQKPRFFRLSPSVIKR